MFRSIITIITVFLSISAVWAADNFSDRKKDYREYVDAVDKTFNILVIGENYYRRDPATGDPLLDGSGSPIVDNSRLLYYPSDFYSGDFRYLKANDIALNEEDIYTPVDGLHVGEADRAEYANSTRLADYAETANYAGYVPATVNSVRYIKTASNAMRALVATSIDYAECPATGTTGSDKCVVEEYLGKNLHAKNLKPGAKVNFARNLLFNPDVKPRQWTYGPNDYYNGTAYQIADSAYHVPYVAPMKYDSDGLLYITPTGTAHIGTAALTVSAGRYGKAIYRYLRGNNPVHKQIYK